jgi:hypothetical protein
MKKSENSPINKLKDKEKNSNINPVTKSTAVVGSMASTFKQAGRNNTNNNLMDSVSRDQITLSTK